MAIFENVKLKILVTLQAESSSASLLSAAKIEIFTNSNNGGELPCFVFDI